MTFTLMLMMSHWLHQVGGRILTRARRDGGSKPKRKPE
jgi:hypothetical protein